MDIQWNAEIVNKDTTGSQDAASTSVTDQESIIAEDAASTSVTDQESILAEDSASTLDEITQSDSGVRVSADQQPPVVQDATVGQGVTDWDVGYIGSTGEASILSEDERILQLEQSMQPSISSKFLDRLPVVLKLKKP